MTARTTGRLDSVTVPADLRRLPEEELEPLAADLRDYLVATVARGGGHLAAGLGALELAVALHYVFDTPRDALVWDVGHQAYAHKALTGRRDRMHTLRRRDGLSGFLRRDESPYDAFGGGHSSTSISAALGIAVAGARSARPSRTVAIIGDGALTAGMPFEALQQAGALPDLDLLVIVNDNGMSISENVGSLSHALNSATAQARDGQPVSVRGWFEALGFQYTGPCDGHDLATLVPTLRTLSATLRPACPARPHAERPRLRARRGGADQVPRGDALRSGGRHRRRPQRSRCRPTPTCSATGCATPPPATLACSPSLPRCAKVRGW